MAAIIEFAPALAFFIFYQSKGLMAAVVALMVCQPLSLLCIRLLGKPITRLHYFTLGAVLVFGSLTLFLRDPIFILVKPTVIYGCVAIGLGVSLLLGKNPARGMFAKNKDFAAVDAGEWTRMSWQWVALAAVLAASNLALAITVDEATWVTLKIFAFPLVILAVLLCQFASMYMRLAKTPSHRMRQALTRAFAPERLEIRDDSDEHLGHAEANAGGHFHLTIVSAKFTGYSLVKRHQLIYASVGDLKELGVHALAIDALTPTEDASADLTLTPHLATRK